jgi:hypothetical protein
MEISRRYAIGTFASTLAMWSANKVRAQSVSAAPALSKIWNTGNVGGPGRGFACQIGDVNGDGLAEAIQLINSGQNSRLGMSLLGWDTTAKTMKILWSTGDIRQGSGALSFQVGDINGDKKAEIIQLWNNGGRLGVIVYGWDSRALAVRTLWSTSDIGQGPGAVGWQVGDVNGDGRDEVIQLWSNNGRLGMIVYGCDSIAMAVKILWNTADIMQGSGAVSFRIGDVNGDKRAEIIQFWNNGGKLAAIVYGWDSTAMAMKTLWSTSDIGQGPGAVGWELGDVNGDGRDEVIQLWSNNGRLGMIVYGWDSTTMAMKTLWSTGDIGQDPGAASFQVGDFNGDKRAEIIQLWNNGGKLAVIAYGWDSTAMAMRTLWSTGDLGAGPDAEWWLVGRMRGKSDDLLQLYSQNGNTGALLYGVM